MEQAAALIERSRTETAETRPAGSQAAARPEAGA
jgi:hypothetical protein